MNKILSAIFVLSAAASTPTVPCGDAPSERLKLETTWEDVASYIEGHATVRNEATEALLEEEAEAGAKTWILVGAVSGGGSRLLWPAAPESLDGPGVGWPSGSLVIRFATATERDIAAGLIEDVTGSAVRRKGLVAARRAFKGTQ